MYWCVDSYADLCVVDTARTWNRFRSWRLGPFGTGAPTNAGQRCKVEKSGIAHGLRGLDYLAYQRRTTLRSKILCVNLMRHYQEGLLLRGKPEDSIDLCSWNKQLNPGSMLVAWSISHVNFYERLQSLQYE